MSSSTLIPTSNYRFAEGSDDDSEAEDEHHGEGQVLNYESEEEHATMQYNAENSFMYPYSKKDSKYYDKEWSEWRYGKPFHSHEWPSSMSFGEQLTSEETYRGATAAKYDEFWGKEDPYDYYVKYEGAPHENISDFVIDRLQGRQARAHGKNVYEMDIGFRETDADLAEGAVYTRSDDVMYDSGRDRYIRLTEKTTPVVINQGPRSDRDMGGRPVIEYMRDTNLPRDQVLRDNLHTGAPTDAPPVLFDLRYPGIRETKFGWISDYGAPDGGYMGEGDSITNNDASKGMINRAQMHIDPIMGPPSSQISGVGDAIAVNEPGGERRKAGGGDVRMSLWGANAGAPNGSSGWLTRIKDILGDGRIRHANDFMSLWGSNPGSPNATAGWKTRVDDISKDGRVRHANKFMSLWGNNPENPNPTAGWKKRVDDIAQDGRLGHANAFMSLWGANPGAPNATDGWQTRPDDIFKDGRTRAGAIHEIWGNNAAAPEPVGNSIALNEVMKGSRISNRSSLVNDDFMLPGAPEGSLGSLNVNQRVPESHGRRPEVMAVTGNRGANENMYNGFFSVGNMKTLKRPDWSRIGGLGGGMEGIYVQDMFNMTNNPNGFNYRSTEPECDLIANVMKGLGSNTIRDMCNQKSFEDLAPTLLW